MIKYMKIEEMKAFAALTDEEQEKKIKIAEATKEAEENFYVETFNDWGGGYSGNNIANCGCGDIYWMITDEYGQKDMCFCFDKYGKIGSAWENDITLGSLTCTNCSGKPKMPSWYLDEHLEAIE